MEKVLILVGSARSESNTLKTVDVLNYPEAEIINLIDLNISPYKYHDTNREDDFMQVVSKMLEADLIVFATPVYWYAMSGLMKVFFDRLTDLLSGERKVLGRRLKRKRPFFCLREHQRKCRLALKLHLNLPVNTSTWSLPVINT